MIGVPYGPVNPDTGEVECPACGRLFREVYDEDGEQLTCLYAEHYQQAHAKRLAHDIREYVLLAAEEGTSPAHEARRDGTYNPQTNRFCCTECYVAIGMPAGPVGGPRWVAP